jgi:hypothetical protein
LRITNLAEKAVPVGSTMRNIAFDFSEMTTSVVAVTTDIRQLIAETGVNRAARTDRRI